MYLPSDNNNESMLQLSKTCSHENPAESSDQDHLHFFLIANITSYPKKSRINPISLQLAELHQSRRRDTGGTDMEPDQFPGVFDTWNTRSKVDRHRSHHIPNDRKIESPADHRPDTGKPCIRSQLFADPPCREYPEP
jgi:hypothetical protein